MILATNSWAYYSFSNGAAVELFRAITQRDKAIKTIKILHV